MIAINNLCDSINARLIVNELLIQFESRIHSLSTMGCCAVCERMDVHIYVTIDGSPEAKLYIMRYQKELFVIHFECG